jgi:hypothetical protein
MVEMERTELIAREAIRDLLARYTWAGDRGRSHELAHCFLVDGVLDVGEHGGRWQGRAEIEAGLDAVTARLAEHGDPPAAVNHHVASVLISLSDPSNGWVRSYFCVYTEHGPDHWGTYRDRVAHDPSDGHWRFAERIVTVTGVAPHSRFV